MENTEEKKSTRPKRAKSTPDKSSFILCPDCLTATDTHEPETVVMFHESCKVLNFGGYAEIILRYVCPNCGERYQHQQPQIKKCQEKSEETQIYG